MAAQLTRVGAFPAKWVWLTYDDPKATEDELATGTIPGAVKLDHGSHTLLVPWVPIMVAGAQVVPFTLESLVPLTIVEPIPCGMCGVTGRIEQGRWMGSEGGQGG